MAYAISKHSGVEGYLYQELPSLIPEEDMIRYCRTTRAGFSALAKTWSASLNGEWWSRLYLSIKLIIGSTIMLTSHLYCTKKNIKIVNPYLLYYAELSCCRALIFTFPEHRADKDLFDMTHQKTINVAIDVIRNISPKAAENVGLSINRCRANRELMSYKMPGAGPATLLFGHKSDTDSVIKICRFIVELAQLRSECLEAALDKHATGIYPLIQEEVMHTYMHDLDNEIIIDENDWYRFSQRTKHDNPPPNLALIATEGMVDDFFGVWKKEESEEETDQSAIDDVYDPDKDSRLLFDFV